LDVCFYFQLHQPYRGRRYRIFDIGTGLSYFDETLNRETLRRVADKCYVPATEILTELASRAGARFALSISGVLLEQLETDAPRALECLQALAATGGVELLGETSHHSLASLENADEFAAQVKQHGAAIKRSFDVTPSVFRNTELIASDALASRVAKMGFTAMLVEGADRVLGGRSPNHVYAAESAPKLRLLPRNYRLSDDVAFRFSDRTWDGWPLTAERYADWIAASAGDVVNVFMDYETFGEHHDAQTGIFDFLLALPAALEQCGVRMMTPSQLAERKPVDTLAYLTPTSWADTERDTSAWLGNRLQQAAHGRLYQLRDPVLASGDQSLIGAWRRLSTSDHFYYMSTKWHADGDVHTYFNPHATPYDAYISYMNVLRDVEQRAREDGEGRRDQKAQTPKSAAAKERDDQRAQRPKSAGAKKREGKKREVEKSEGEKGEGKKRKSTRPLPKKR
jgi:alpha-amylase